MNSQPDTAWPTENQGDPPVPNSQPPQTGSDGARDGSQINPGTKPNAVAPAPPHANPDAVEHAMIGETGKKQGGKEEGLVNPPTVSLNPTSQPQGDADADAEVGEHTIVDNVNMGIFSNVAESQQKKFDYPFSDLKHGQGMFIPVEKGKTTDDLMAKLYKMADQFRKQNSDVERDEDGDDVMEDVAINKKQRNDDGTVKLDGGVPRLGIKSGFRPKLIGPQLIVRAVVKGDKLSDGNEAEGDGALVIRLA